MLPEKDKSSNAANSPAIDHVSSAHQLLQVLRKRIGEHPELAEAIRKLETALNILTVNTGGML
ncbi:MAG TPA: hypothetical protein VEI49_04180 [Terriglobales bacterium]|nr:hypothetical protein [Terriglobales bacterium]